MSKKILNLAKKLKALSELGEGGEKINAEKMLRDLMQANSITEEDIEKDNPTIHFFIVDESNKYECRLLVQIAALSNVKISGIISKEIATQFNFPKDTNCCAECTDFQYIDILSKFDFYKVRLNKRLEEFFYAYLYAQDLLLEAPKSTKKSDNDIEADLSKMEEYYNAMRFASQMSKDNFLKGLN